MAPGWMWKNGPINLPNSNHRYRPIMFSIGTKIYFGGGGYDFYLQATNGGYNDFWEYDTVTTVWRQVASLPTQRWRSGCASHGGKGYIFGGAIQTNSFATIDTAYVYDPVANTWTSFISSLGWGLPSYAHCCAVTIGDYIWMAWGVAAGNANLSVYKVHVPTKAYSWVTNSVYYTPASSWGEFNMFAIGDKLYFFGGMQDTNAVVNTRGNTVIRYDTTLNTWATVANIPTGQFMGCGVGIGTLGFSIGGQAASVAFANTQIYDVNTNTWSAGPVLPAARVAMGACAVDGDIYLMGGLTRAGQSGNGMTGQRYEVTKYSYWLDSPTLTYVTNSSTSVTLNWTDVAEETSYVIERKLPTDLNYIVLAEVPADTLTYTDDTVDFNVNDYMYRIKARKLF